MAIYPYTNSSFTDKSVSMRRQIIETIEKLRRGESFEAFKEKFIQAENAKISDDDMKKLYISHDFVDLIIEKLVSYCPNLIKAKATLSSQRKLIENALIDIGWNDILHENYDTLESSGDTFLEIYFENGDDKIPKLRVLTSKNMERALLDDYNRYIAYIYKEWVEDLEPNLTTGCVNARGRRERIIVFVKGGKYIYDPLFDKKGIQKKDKKGNLQFNVEFIENRASYVNDFPLIHIKGRKNQSEEFSKIPAEKYIDLSLATDQQVSDLRQSNRMLGYPTLFLFDGEMAKNATRSPASIIPVASKKEKQAYIKDIQISNSLNSMFEEYIVTRDILYDKAGLITPTLREKLNVDSSRVIQQLNIQSENKIELYVDNTIDAMRLWFKILLSENDMYVEKRDKNLSFIKPKFIIKTSPFDELLYEASEVKQTKKSRHETYVENMDSDEEIKKRKKEINEEIGDDGKDKSFTDEQVDRVSNGQNVDKNMIT